MAFFAELKRRNVIRVAVLYVVFSWLILQVADVLFGVTRLPDWSLTMVAIILGLGFVPALVFAWIYELTPEGIKREKDVDRSTSVTHRTARRLDIVVIVLITLAIGLFALDRLVLDRQTSSGDATTVAGTGVSTGSGTLSIAILPFANMSPDADNEYFADGISEEILNLLSDVRDLSVASRTSAFAFKGKDTPIPEIAAALNVRYVLEGSVRKAGDQVRVTAQLIDAATDRHLWSDTYDRTLEDIFAIQDDIAGAIGDALQVELLGSSGAKVKSQEIDPEIYARFLEARHLLRQRTRESMRKANEMLIRIVEAEPGFAGAHVVLGEAYLLNRALPFANPLVPNEIAGPQARIHAEIARSLNPDLGGIDLILGSIAEDGGNPSKALEHYARAIELEPREPRPYHWRGILYCQAGYLERALADFSIALQLDPENPNVRFATTDCLISTRDLDRARELASAAIRPGNAAGMDLVAIIELETGNREAAADVIRDIIGLGWRVEFMRRVLGLIEQDPPIETGTEAAPSEAPGDRGLLLALGQIDAYLDHLSTLRHSPNGNPGAWSPRHAEMRRDPRFMAFIEGIGMTDLWRKLGPPPDCRAEGDSFSCGHGSEGVEYEAEPLP